MTTEPIQLDGDLRDVLESIARHPNARLFRRDASVVRALGRGEAVVRRPTEPRLIAAERQLLQVHRVSMAELLRQVAAAALRACAEGNGAMFWTRSPLSKEGWRNECKRFEAVGCGMLSERLFQPETFTLAKVRSLASDALQFEDHSNAWSYIVLSYFVENRSTVTRSMTTSLLQRPWTPLGRHHLLGHLACAQSDLGDYRPACQNYLAAARLVPSNARAWCRAIGHGFLARDDAAVNLSDQELRGLSDAARAVSVVAQEISSGYQASAERVAEDHQTFRRLEGHLSDDSRKLLHAFL